MRQRQTENPVYPQGPMQAAGDGPAPGAALSPAGSVCEGLTGRGLQQVVLPAGDIPSSRTIQVVHVCPPQGLT